MKKPNWKIIALHAVGVLALVAIGGLAVWQYQRLTVPKLPVVEVTPSVSSDEIVWSEEIQDFLVKRDRDIVNIMTSSPTDEHFLQQASVLVSIPFAYSIGPGDFARLSSVTATSPIYFCPVDGDIGTDQRILSKVRSQDGRSTLYVFGNEERKQGYFVVRDNRLTQTARLFAACKGSDQLESVRWIDNDTVEETTNWMGSTTHNQVEVKW